MIPNHHRQQQIDQMIECHRSTIKIQQFIVTMIEYVGITLMQQIQEQNIGNFVHPNPCDLSARCEPQIASRSDTAGHCIPYHQKRKDERTANAHQQHHHPVTFERGQYPFDLALCCHIITTTHCHIAFESVHNFTANSQRENSSKHSHHQERERERVNGH